MPNEEINIIIEETVQEINVQVSDASESVTVVINEGTPGVSKHSELDLDDGTNPHGTTKSDVGLSNVPNLDTTNAVNDSHTHSNKSTLDLITEAFTTALKTNYDLAYTWVVTNGASLLNHLTNFSNPHNVTKSQVGLSNVDNTSDADKPISTATQTALDLKLDAADYNDRFKGKFTSLANLQSAHPTANDGDYAIVDAGSGTDALEYIWDTNEGWVKGNSPGAATTDALTEGSTNLYWTVARGLGLVLSGLSAASGTFTSSDTLLTAFGKIKYLIDNIATTYQAILVSGTNIKTVGGTSLLGSGNIPIDTQLYATISGNTTLDDTYHDKTIWVTATCNITIPSGLRADFNCSFRTFTGVTATFLTSGTTINSESDGDVQEARTMSYLAVYSTNNYIISGGGLS